MTETVAACPLCGSPESRFFDRRMFRDLPVINRVCTSCGLVFQSPRMTEAELSAFYAGEYRRLYQGDEGPSAKDLAVQRLRARSLLDFARPHLARVRRHLDIGCSSGLLLECFGEALGSAPVGIEPGDAYRRHAQSKGIPVFPDLPALEATEPQPFDLISLAHVLEHLAQPVAYLATLRENLLAEDGCLLLEVPNLYAHDSFEIAHLVSYSPHTLVQAVQQAGFEVIHQQAHGQPRSNMLPLYVTLLARPARQVQPPPLIPERRVALKRQVGMLRRRLLTRLFPRQAWLPTPAA